LQQSVLVAQYQNAIKRFCWGFYCHVGCRWLGIIVGVVFCKRIPERTFKWLSATIFILFGLVGLI